MPAAQRLLFPDPKPLVERLGQEFFRGLPRSPGVYLMRDAADTVLYVGKAKSLRQRLGSYRVANPDRMARRHLRLLRAVVRIEFEHCADEPAALAREAELLRLLKPKFNRAGTWSAPGSFLNWRTTAEGLQLALTPELVGGFEMQQALRGGGKYFFRALVRLLWCALHPERGVLGMPAGCFHGKMGDTVLIACSKPEAGLAEAIARLEELFRNDAGGFIEWVQARTAGECALGLRCRDADLELVVRTARMNFDKRSGRPTSG